MSFIRPKSVVSKEKTFRHTSHLQAWLKGDSLLSDWIANGENPSEL